MAQLTDTDAPVSASLVSHLARGSQFLAELWTACLGADWAGGQQPQMLLNVAHLVAGNQQPPDRPALEVVHLLNR